MRYLCLHGAVYACMLGMFDAHLNPDSPWSRLHGWEACLHIIYTSQVGAHQTVTAHVESLAGIEFRHACVSIQSLKAHLRALAPHF